MFRPLAAARAIAVRWSSCAKPAIPRRSSTEASWEGQIGFERRGTGGFGYDPLFIVAGLTITAAEMPAAEKNRVSHRGQALAALAERMKDAGW